MNYRWGQLLKLSRCCVGEVSPLEMVERGISLDSAHGKPVLAVDLEWMRTRVGGRVSPRLTSRCRMCPLGQIF